MASFGGSCHTSLARLAGLPSLAVMLGEPCALPWPARAIGARDIVAGAPLLPSGDAVHTRGHLSNGETSRELEELYYDLHLLTLRLALIRSSPGCSSGEGDVGGVTKGVKKFKSSASLALSWES